MEDFLLLKVVKFAVSRNAEKLEFYISKLYWFTAFNLPPSFFKCQSFKVLKVQALCSCEFPVSLDWASLETLSLSDLTLCNPPLIRTTFKGHRFDVFSKCLNLQNLTLQGVRIYQQTFVISAPRLVFLTLTNIRVFIEDPKNSKLEIIAPRLTRFYFGPSHLMVLSMANSPILNQVDFGLNHYCPCNSQEDARVLIDIMKQLGNARSLTISIRVIEVLLTYVAALDGELSPFVSLESLTVKLKGRNESSTIPLPLMNFFLGGSPSATMKAQMDFLEEKGQ